MVRVAMDGRALSDASSFRGIGTYLRVLLPALAARADVKVTVLAPPAVAGSLPEGVALAAHRRLAPDRWASAEHHLLLPRELAAVDADVDHSPALDPPRRRSSRPWVQTVADVLPLVDPDPAFSVERRRWRRWAPRVRAADAVITFSSFAAEEVSRELDLDRGRVHVIPLPPGPRFTPPADDGPGTRRPSVLFVSEYGPHKGFAEAAAVATRLGAAGLPHRVAMAGRVVPATAPLVRAAVAGAGDRVEVLGWVGNLVPLYQRATALLVTSRHEGFGLPAVEAMACATPVVAFDNSATAEVVAGGGMLVPDGDVEAAARALVGLLSSPERWQEASRAARARAAALAEVDVAARHVDVYRHVTGR
jgi:glycosyltransferase involved in cell wall biosynthesis